MNDRPPGIFQDGACRSERVRADGEESRGLGLYERRQKDGEKTGDDQAVYLLLSI